MFVEAALLAWSLVALAWWAISLGLVRAAMSRVEQEVAVPQTASSPTLTIFKPLPPLGGEEVRLEGITSFLAQIGSNDELLLGAHEADRARLEPALAELRASFPPTDWQVIWRAEPDAVPNPKIAWLEFLAPHARGELWLWSDADIVAPRDFLRSARAEYAAGNARLVTWPYVVREVAAAPALLDALYVNAEFLPGVLLLRRRGPVDFGLGAALLFARSDFASSVTWRELGRALADDFQLGQKLRPVRIGRALLTTAAEGRTWREAALHYLRWSKTVRWNRPGGTAARLVVLPVLGWLAWVALRPGDAFAWTGLVAMMQLDVLAAWFILRRIGCPLRAREAWVLELWSLGRALAWAACWLPWPVTWRGRQWRGPLAKHFT